LAIAVPAATLGTLRMVLVWRLLNVLMALLFVFAAALQYNDPDPIRWAAIYLAAGLPCALAARGKPVSWLPLVVGLLSLAWAVTYLVRGVPSVSPLHMFDEWEMKNQQVVETRELFGLLIATVWMAALWLAARGRKTAVE